MIWPGISFGLVGGAYLASCHGVFGKRQNGTMALPATVALLPFLVYIWLIWHTVRLVSKESSYAQVTDGIYAGRRLLGSEMPRDIETFIDLTCEFPEPQQLRQSRTYIAAPMLDAMSLPPQELAELSEKISASDRPIYIHCAQAHGRTGMVAALVLLKTQEAKTPAEALRKIQKVRPGLKINRRQQTALDKAFCILGPENEK